MLALVLATMAVGQAGMKAQPYDWKNVQIVGGGFVDGIVFHPTAKGVRYARTDIGGAYRWDERTRRWVPLLDWLGYDDLNLVGVESIGLDPSDPNRLYLACGTYTNATTPNGAILRSRDRGKTFQRTNMPFKMGANENGRGNGERLAVDPNDGRIVYFGSRHAGLWRSEDAAVTWKKVESFPAVGEPVGTIAVVFDPASGTKGKGSDTIYAAVSQTGESIFASHDHGATWQAVAGQPTTFRPTHMVRSGDGTFYLTYGSSAGPSPMRDGAVWRYSPDSGEWTDITPDKPGNGRNFGYAAVSVDAQHPQTLVVSSFYRPQNEEMFRSTDGGKSWRTSFGGGEIYDFSLAPYVGRTPIHWLFDVEIDPFDSNHVMFTTGYGGYETFNDSDIDSGKSSKWSVMSTGIEETVGQGLLSPPSGAHLITAIGDYGGFVHWDLDKPVPEGNFDHPHFGNTSGVDCAWGNPDVIVRVGQASGNRGGGNIGYSLDGGKTWQTTLSLPAPGANSGRISVASDGTTWVWSLPRGRSYYTRDRGATWFPCEGLPSGIRNVVFEPGAREMAYALSLFDGKLYRSHDGGVSFEELPLDFPGGPPKQGGDRGDWRGGQDQLYVAPNTEGQLWIAAFDGLYRTRSTVGRCERIADVQEVHAFGFGASRSKDSFTIYLVGTVKGVEGIFRSDDEAKNWVRINDDRHQWGLVLQICGDPRIYGRVYVGTHGRGVFYGDPRR